MDRHSVSAARSLLGRLLDPIRAREFSGAWADSPPEEIAGVAVERAAGMGLAVGAMDAAFARAMQLAINKELCEMQPSAAVILVIAQVPLWAPATSSAEAFDCALDRLTTNDTALVAILAARLKANLPPSPALLRWRDRAPDLVARGFFGPTPDDGVRRARSQSGPEGP